MPTPEPNHHDTLHLLLVELAIQTGVRCLEVGPSAVRFPDPLQQVDDDTLIIVSGHGWPSAAGDLQQHDAKAVHVTLHGQLHGRRIPT